ncbi:MAG: glycyl-tRNA synthetase [Puniceicoccaceae bacterium 5H]|nr:MAG: glycyl-tRNA synthetase [Puniceicoccaceae bacterium 5H]
METLVNLCKRKGFVYPSSDIYGGYAGFFDYGPLGAEVKKNIKDAWWKALVHEREDVVGLDSTIIMHPDIWKASGHVDGFVDPMVDCRESRLRYRADQLFYAPIYFIEEGGNESGLAGYAVIVENEDIQGSLIKRASTIRKAMEKKGAKVDETALTSNIKEFTEATEQERELAWGPDATRAGTLTEPRQFNLMFTTKVGPLADDSATAYLRPETAQGIFQNYKNVVDTTRVKIPFGIAQIGKAFRNEITPRNFIFRSREFEQMELEYFIDPDEGTWPEVYRYWIDWGKDWLKGIGVDPELLSEDVHPQEKLSHYSKGTTDIMFHFPFGVQELWGIACRGDFDLKQHQEHSGKSMDFFDDERKQAGKEPFKYIPNVVEPSLGVDRTFLAVMTSAYQEDEIPNEKGKLEKRVVLRFHPRIAPYKAAVFPLLKNKPELVEKARELYTKLSRRWNIFWDASGAIGRRYRRQDEIGTPYGITVDFDTIEKDNTVTIRDRDTTEQIRLPIDQVESWLSEKIYG